MRKITFWEAVKRIGLCEADIITEYRAWFLWHNRTNPEGVLRLLEDKKYQMLGKFRYYFEIILKAKDKRKALFRWMDFVENLEEEISVYRGNGGIFDPNITERFPFVAMTASYDIALMFAQYRDAKAVHLPVPPKRSQCWVVEVKLPLKNILGYRNLADREVWISLSDYKKAKVVTQCGN